MLIIVYKLTSEILYPELLVVFVSKYYFINIIHNNENINNNGQVISIRHLLLKTFWNIFKLGNNFPKIQNNAVIKKNKR